MMRIITFLAKRRLNAVDSAGLGMFTYLAVEGRPILAALAVVVGVFVSLVLEATVKARHEREKSQ